MAKKIGEKLEITKSSGNVFADLGVPHPEKHLAKAELAHQINKIIEDRGLKQSAAAEILGLDQPKISALHCGRLDDFSIERLIGFLNRLDHDVKIVIKMKPPYRKDQGRLKIAFG